MSAKEFTLKLAPSIELEEYVWLKVEVSGTFSGSRKHALRELELMYWEAVALELKLRDEVRAAYDEKKNKSLKKLTKKKIEKFQLLLNKSKEK